MLKVELISLISWRIFFYAKPLSLLTHFLLYSLHSPSAMCSHDEVFVCPVFVLFHTMSFVFYVCILISANPVPGHIPGKFPEPRGDRYRVFVAGLFLRVKRGVQLGLAHWESNHRQSV